MMRAVFRKPILRIPRLLVFLLGFATGCAMAGLGLAARLTGSIPDGFPAAWFGTAFFEAAGITAGRIGWMLVLEGIFWIAALAALAVRNHWGWWSSLLAGLISLIFFPGGTLAGIAALLAVGVRLVHKKFGKPAAKAKLPAQG